MKKEPIILIVVALVVGILGSVVISNTKLGSTPNEQRPVSAPVIDYQQKIRTLQRIVATEPENRKAWVQLGHNYFDSAQPMKAIEAYDKALELDGNDPDVLTDQGVMYRRFGWYDKAIENFTKANKLKSDHKQSLFNLGIVYRDDLQDAAKAKEVWNRYLEIAPKGEGADKVRIMLDHMENGHG